MAIGIAAVLAVFAFLPPEGFLSGPLHQALAGLLGRSTFVLPVLLVLGGALRLAHVPLPRARLVGLVVLTLSVLTAEQLLVEGDAGVVGRWLAQTALGAVGGIGTAVVLLSGLAAGALLTFGVRLGAK